MGYFLKNTDFAGFRIIVQTVLDALQYRSVVGAVSFNLLSEALRPLEIYKWIIIPVLLILVMLYRPTGLISFREFDVSKLLQPKRDSEDEVEYAAAD